MKMLITPIVLFNIFLHVSDFPKMHPTAYGGVVRCVVFAVCVVASPMVLSLNDKGVEFLFKKQYN